MRLGMRQCSLRLVYYQCEARDLRLDWYGAFWRWCEALWLSNREGAEFLIADFFARIEGLRARPRPDLDWFELLARCEESHSEAMCAAIRNRDVKALMTRLPHAISAYHELLAAARSRLPGADSVRDVA